MGIGLSVAQKIYQAQLKTLQRLFMVVGDKDSIFYRKTALLITPVRRCLRGRGGLLVPARLLTAHETSLTSGGVDVDADK